MPMMMTMMTMIWVLRLWWNRAGLVSKSEPFLFLFEISEIVKLEFEKQREDLY